MRDLKIHLYWVQQNFTKKEAVSRFEMASFMFYSHLHELRISVEPFLNLAGKS